MYHSFCIHPPTDGPLSCSQILVFVNNTALNTGMHMFFQISVLVFFRYPPKSGIAGSKGSFTFSFFEEIPYCFPQWLHQSAFPPKMYRDLFSPQPQQHLLLVYLFIQTFNTYCFREWLFQWSLTSAMYENANYTIHFHSIGYSH